MEDFTDLPEGGVALVIELLEGAAYLLGHHCILIFIIS
jgi:hypothetical protein